MKSLDRKKAEGCDGIPAEFLHPLLRKPLNQFIKLCKKIYKEGVWPSDFKRSVLVPLEKKRNATRCEDFRTISLILHATKVVLRIIKRRLETKVEEFLTNNQFGFRKKRGTREAIGVMRCLVERRIEFNKDLYVCFVEAFDLVDWKKLMRILEEIGVDWRDRRLIIWNRPQW